MKFGTDGIQPDPTKVEALDFLLPPTNKQDLISFLCMMQSNADFIKNCAKKSAPLRELTKGNIHFKWNDSHQECFEYLDAPVVPIGAKNLPAIPLNRGLESKMLPNVEILTNEVNRLLSY